MVSRLTLNTIGFFQPFLAKSLSLFALAFRTISLFAILSIKRMSELTMSFHGIYSTERTRVFKRVLTSGNFTKMRYSYTISVLANMVNNHPITNTSVGDKVRHTMSAAILFTKVERAIAILIEFSFPQITLARPLRAIIKSVPFLTSYRLFHVPHGIPCNSLSQYKYV